MKKKISKKKNIVLKIIFFIILLIGPLSHSLNAPSPIIPILFSISFLGLLGIFFIDYFTKD